MIDGSIVTCPACGTRFSAPRSAESATGTECPRCGTFVVVRTTFSPNAPGHEEHDEYTSTVIASGRVARNARCPCGSGRAFGKCCGRKRVKGEE